MSTHEISKKEEFSFTPTTLKEAQEYANIIANSGICPESFKGRPNDVLIVLQLGHELGLKPMQALRCLGVINGMPFAYGDGQLALIKVHPQFDDMKEWFEGDLKDGTLTAYCTVIRKDKESVTQKFSIEDAKRAGLWGNPKRSPWIQYPKRMLQHRARTYAIKDALPDALFGLPSQDEAYSITDSKKSINREVKGAGISGLEQTLGINDPEIIEGEVIAEKTEHEILCETLSKLLEEKKVPTKSVKKWCDQFNVDNITLISTDNIKQIINYLEVQ